MHADKFFLIITLLSRVVFIVYFQLQLNGKTYTSRTPFIKTRQTSINIFQLAQIEPR